MGLVLNPKAPHSEQLLDLAALGAWVFRRDVRYMRALCKLKNKSHRWSRRPNALFARFASEAGALEWVSQAVEATELEQARLSAYRESRIHEQTAEVVDAQRLLSEYEDNEIRADLEYKNHVVQFTGRCVVARRSGSRANIVVLRPAATLSSLAIQ
jgi:hypothetical protein